MRAGVLNRTIALERLSETVSAAGTVTTTWTTIVTVRAERVTNAAIESAIPAGVAETVTVLFRLRFVAGITTADRVRFEGTAYNIVGIDEIGRKRGLELRVNRTPS